MIKHIRKVKLGNRGFTLIEVIVSLVLLGIIALMAGLGLVGITKQYLFAQKAGETAQVAQVAMARMVKELTLMRRGTSAGATSITVNTPDSPTTVRTVTISWAGSSANPQPILITRTAGAQPLIENVTDFTLTYYTAYNAATSSYSQTGTVMVGISFKVKGADNIESTFSGRAFVRN